MNTLSDRVTADGAVVDVLVGLALPDVQALRQAGKPVPMPIATRALIDLGADASCVDPRVLASLINSGLTASRVVLVNIPAGGHLKASTEYAVSITLVHSSGLPHANLVLRSQAIVEQSFGALNYQVLLGRDVLERCLLVYDGPGKLFTLAY